MVEFVIPKVVPAPTINVPELMKVELIIARLVVVVEKSPLKVAVVPLSEMALTDSPVLKVAVTLLNASEAPAPTSEPEFVKAALLRVKVVPLAIRIEPLEVLVKVEIPGFRLQLALT